MNPSATGWILKYITQEALFFKTSSLTKDALYTRLKYSGFIYGHSIHNLVGNTISTHPLTTEELTKVNLLHALWETDIIYNGHGEEASTRIQRIANFYKEWGKVRRNFFQKLLFPFQKEVPLEQILAQRLYEEKPVLGAQKGIKVFARALLYLDVLTYQSYLEKPEHLNAFIAASEHLILQFVLQALVAKSKKDTYDKALLDLFEDSLSYEDTTASSTFWGGKNLELPPQFQQYLMDIITLTLWSDHKIDTSESAFLKMQAKRLGFAETQMQENINTLRAFTAQHNADAGLFVTTTAFNHFYNQNKKLVQLLVLRNKKRLLKEIQESGELVKLLAVSAKRDLSKEEKKMVRAQLLDIFKTIPSLAIFILPGGSILLPIFIKYIPTLLPSAFNENRIEQ